VGAPRYSRLKIAVTGAAIGSFCRIPVARSSAERSASSGKPQRELSTSLVRSTRALDVPVASR
jgi:hypothetical protein